MTLPTFGGQIWPAGGVSDPAPLIAGIRTFVPTLDLNALQVGAYRTFLGLTGGASVSGDSDQVILPTQIFGA